MRRTEVLQGRRLMKFEEIWERKRSNEATLWYREPEMVLQTKEAFAKLQKNQHISTVFKWLFIVKIGQHDLPNV